MKRGIMSDAPQLRSRFARAIRWPAILWRYKQIPGVSWASAIRWTHFVIWYQPQP